MFKFDFVEEEPGVDDTDLAAPNEDSAEDSNATELFPAAQISLDSLPYEELTVQRFGYKKCLLRSETLQRDALVSAPLAAAVQRSDLVPGVYEGGFKLWECAVDLVAWASDAAFPFAGKRVLELGCGHGLPGIFAAVSGAAVVHFQDYNAEVVERITIPNVALNCQDRLDWRSQCRFFCGDWSALDRVLAGSGAQYDVILTSDTLYNPDSYPKLLAVFRNHLAPGAVALVAAKSYYFGVGGSVREFLEAAARDGSFRATPLRKLDDAASNVREIFQLERVA